MAIKILLKPNREEISLPLSGFKEVMGVEYTPHLHFLKPKVRNLIERRCLRADVKKRFGQRQRWLGHYYANEIQSARLPDITIAWIDETVGYGVWTNRDIPAFTYIGEYTGVLRRPYFFKDRDNYYCFNYYITMSYAERNLWAPYLIDAREMGNFTRYINHSARPNLDMASAYHGGMLHIIFYAKTLIPKGTQLTYDYGPIYWEKRAKPILI